MVENKQQCFIKSRKKERNKEVKKKIERINYWQEIFRICYKVIFYEKKKKMLQNWRRWRRNINSEWMNVVVVVVVDNGYKMPPFQFNSKKRFMLIEIYYSM